MLLFCHFIERCRLIQPVAALVLFFVFNNSSHAQSLTDLEAYLQNANTPTLKFEANLRLAKYWQQTNASKGIPFAQRAIEQASILKNKYKLTEVAFLGGALAEKAHLPIEAMRFYRISKDSSTLEQQHIALQSIEKMEQIAIGQNDYKTAYGLSVERNLLWQAHLNSMTESKLKQQETTMNELLLAKKKEGHILPALLGGFSFLLAIGYYFRRRSDRRMRGEMAEKNAIIEEKRRRSEQLLLNILPQAVAAELTVRNKVAARRYERATVMFVDFVGFTKVAEAMQPEDLVAEIDFCFSRFDAIIDRMRIEKIKTVGDAYICASGLTDRNERPANMIQAAIAIQAFLKEYGAKRTMEGKPHFEARIGIQFGPVVAGVVGTKKFAYDIWGDTVNTAARLEEVCQAGRINVGAAAMEIVKSEFEWEYRGQIATKNKSEMAMYYVSKLTKSNF